MLGETARRRNERKSRRHSVEKEPEHGPFRLWSLKRKALNGDLFGLKGRE